MSLHPQYDLSIKRRDIKDRSTTKAGAGWVNPDGSISIKLNPAVVIDSRDNLLVTLFKRSTSGSTYNERKAVRSEESNFADDSAEEPTLDDLERF